MEFTRRSDAQKLAEYLADAAAEASFYQEAASELADGKRIEGVWIKALANNEMDEAKAAGAYIQKRVEILKAERYLEVAKVEEAEEKRLSEMTEADRRKAQMAKNFAD
jgi:hypothetical protein